MLVTIFQTIQGIIALVRQRLPSLSSDQTAGWFCHPLLTWIFSSLRTCHVSCQRQSTINTKQQWFHDQQLNVLLQVFTLLSSARRTLSSPMNKLSDLSFHSASKLSDFWFLLVEHNFLYIKRLAIYFRQLFLCSHETQHRMKMFALLCFFFLLLASAGKSQSIANCELKSFQRMLFKWIFSSLPGTGRCTVWAVESPDGQLGLSCWTRDV